MEPSTAADTTRLLQNIVKTSAWGCNATPSFAHLRHPRTSRPLPTAHSSLPAAHCTCGLSALAGACLLSKSHAQRRWQPTTICRRACVWWSHADCCACPEALAPAGSDMIRSYIIGNLLSARNTAARCGSQRLSELGERHLLPQLKLSLELVTQVLLLAFPLAVWQEVSAHCGVLAYALAQGWGLLLVRLLRCFPLNRPSSVSGCSLRLQCVCESGLCAPVFAASAGSRPQCRYLLAAFATFVQQDSLLGRYADTVLCAVELDRVCASSCCRCWQACSLWKNVVLRSCIQLLSLDGALLGGTPAG